MTGSYYAWSKEHLEPSEIFVGILSLCVRWGCVYRYSIVCVWDQMQSGQLMNPTLGT